MFKELILILMAGVLVNNYVLQQFLGICPFLGVSKKVNQATGMGVAVTFVMLCATAVTYPLFTYILVPCKLEYLQTISFILVIAALVQFVEIVLKKYILALYKSLGVCAIKTFGAYMNDSYLEEYGDKEIIDYGNLLSEG